MSSHLKKSENGANWGKTAPNKLQITPVGKSYTIYKLRISNNQGENDVQKID